MNSYSNGGVGTEVPLASCLTNLTDQLAVLRLRREKHPRGSWLVAYRDEWAIVPPDRADDHSPMKRIAAAPLWFLVGWFMGSAIAWAFGFSALLAPIVALALAGIVVADPRGVIWNQAPVKKAPMARMIGTAKAHTS